MHLYTFCITTFLLFCVFFPGESLNPAIDVGQIEGAFMQGYGLFVMGETVMSPDGNLFTKGPGTYKLPGFGDIPKEFNVSLLKGSSNPRVVYSSKVNMAFNYLNEIIFKDHLSGRPFGSV